MKIKQLVLIALCLLCLNANAQLKVFTGGSVTIGSTASPATNGINHQILGSKTAFPSSASSFTSMALIRGNNAYSGTSTPDFTWWGDDVTGLFHPANNVIGITIGNSEKFRFNSSGQLLNSNTTSTASAPDFSWNSETGSGMFRPTSGAVAFAVLGSEKLRLNSYGQILNSNSTSSVSTPDFSWNSDGNTGIYRPGSDLIGMVTGGTERLRIDNNGKVGIGTTSPSEKLHVSGNTILGGTVKFDGWTDIFFDWSNGYCCGLPFLWPESDWGLQIGDASHAVAIEYIYDLYYHTGLHTYSDKNIKDNINYNDNSVAKLKQLKPVTYNYKASAFTTTISNIAATKAAKKHYGLIAQDLQTVFPDLVEPDPSSNLLTVNYIELIPIILQGYIAQQNKIDSLQQQINDCCQKSGNRLITPQGSGMNAAANEDINSTGTYIKQNTPNPFNKETSIEYFIAEKNANASVMIFDMNGKLLKTYKINGNGMGNLVISGNEFAPGMYYYSLLVNAKEIGTKKMILTE